jgi:hypothetical protein
MTPQAWIVIGEREHRSVYLDRVRAVQSAIERHGIVKALVLEERVMELVDAAFMAGVERRNEPKR